MRTKKGDGEARRCPKGAKGEARRMEAAPSPASTRSSVVWVGNLRFVDLKSIDVYGWWYTPESIRKNLCGAHLKGFTSKAADEALRLMKDQNHEVDDEPPGESGVRL